MAPGPDLLSAIDAIGSSRFDVTTFRHTAPDRDPLSGAGARLFGGRWNHQNGPATIYLAEPVQAAISEFLRMAEGQGRGTASFLPRNIHEIALDGVELVDLRSPAALASVGLTLADIEADSWTDCQDVGAAVELLGYTGLVAPSATGVGDVYAVFETRLDPERVTVTSHHDMSDYL